MVRRVVTSIADTITSEASKDERYSRRPTLTVRNVTARRLFSYLQARGLVDRPGVLVVGAVLRQYPIADFPTTTFQLYGPLKSWSPSTLTWRGQPDVGPVTTRSGAGVKEKPFDLDVKDFATGWVTGTKPNHGLQIRTTSTAAAGRSFHSVNATGSKARFRPVLILDLSYRPDAPNGIMPAGGPVSASSVDVTWRYTGADVEPMIAYQVQTNPNNAWNAPAADTGWLDGTEPRHTITGVTVDGKWFRIRHRSADGRESEWSEPIQIGLVARPTVTITSTESTTSDPSPSTTWTVTGGVQTAYQVLLLNADTLAVLADSKIQPGDATGWAPPSTSTLPVGVPIMREVRVWDDSGRVVSSGQPAYTPATAGPVTITPSTTVAAPASIDLDNPLGPAVDVTFPLAQTPDEVIVERRMRINDTQPWGPWVQFRAEAGEVAIGGGLYRYRDVTAPGWHDLEYRARAVTNGSMSEASPTAPFRLRPQFIWLVDPDEPTWMLAMAGNDEFNAEPAEDSALHIVPGSDRAHVVHEGRRGWEGSVTGLFRNDVPGMGDASAQVQRNKTLQIKPVHVYRLCLGDMNIPVIIRKPVPKPQPGGEPRFGVSADFVQQGEVWWADA